MQREIAVGQAGSPTSHVWDNPSSIEAKIHSTLGDLVVSAASSYVQALKDLEDTTRVSFRGTANELRSALWDVLDRLAPDQSVLAAGFKLEKGHNKPTQKQKVRFILRSRGVAKTATKAPESSVGLVDELVASLARASYDRSSISSHVATERSEVLQIKMYVDSVLAELLEIHL